MWVVLVVDILNKEHDGGRVHKLRQRLGEIPGDLFVSTFPGYLST